MPQASRLDRLVHQRHRDLLNEEPAEQAAFHTTDALRLGVDAKQARDVVAIIDSIWSMVR